MADTWYVKVDDRGVVVRVFVDDMEKPEPGDIQLDPMWYYGTVNGIKITDPLGHRFTVECGRLVPRRDEHKVLAQKKEKRMAEVEEQPLSPILGKKRRERLPKAKAEVADHIARCINTEEVVHTLLLGY